MARRRCVDQLATWPRAASLPILSSESRRTSRLEVLLKCAWDSDDPTKAPFSFSLRVTDRQRVNPIEHAGEVGMADGGPSFRLTPGMSCQVAAHGYLATILFIVD